MTQNQKCLMWSWYLGIFYTLLFPLTMETSNYVQNLILTITYPEQDLLISGLLMLLTFSTYFALFYVLGKLFFFIKNRSVLLSKNEDLDNAVNQKSPNLLSSSKMIKIILAALVLNVLLCVIDQIVFFPGQGMYAWSLVFLPFMWGALVIHFFLFGFFYHSYSIVSRFVVAMILHTVLICMYYYFSWISGDFIDRFTSQQTEIPWSNIIQFILIPTYSFPFFNYAGKLFTGNNVSAQ